jgi:hypothetical protein
MRGAARRAWRGRGRGPEGATEGRAPRRARGAPPAHRPGRAAGLALARARPRWNGAVAWRGEWSDVTAASSKAEGKGDRGWCHHAHRAAAAAAGRAPLCAPRRGGRLGGRGRGRRGRPVGPGGRAGTDHGRELEWGQGRQREDGLGMGPARAPCLREGYRCWHCGASVGVKRGRAGGGGAPRPVLSCSGNPSGVGPTKHRSGQNGQSRSNRPKHARATRILLPGPLASVGVPRRAGAAP